MSVGTAATTAEHRAHPRVVNFAEESCFTRDEKFRTIRTPVVFRLYSIGKHLGPKIDVDIQADYGVYYDMDNGYLIGVLQERMPGVAWDKYTFWCQPDQSRITVINPADDKPVAHLETRRYHGKPVSAVKVDAGEYGPDVISFAQCVRRQAERAAAEAEAGTDE